MLGEINLKNLHSVWLVLANVSGFSLVLGIAFKANMHTKSAPSKSKEKQIVSQSFQKSIKIQGFRYFLKG